MNQRTRKLMTVHTAKHPRNDVDQLYVSRKERERGLVIIEDNVDALIQLLEGYIEKWGERLMIATRKNTYTKSIIMTKITRKYLCRHVKRQTAEISHEKTWAWLRSGNLKRETESLLIVAQNDAIKSKSRRNALWSMSRRKKKKK